MIQEAEEYAAHDEEYVSEIPTFGDEVELIVLRSLRKEYEYGNTFESSPEEPKSQVNENGELGERLKYDDDKKTSLAQIDQIEEKREEVQALISSVTAAINDPGDERRERDEL